MSYLLQFPPRDRPPNLTSPPYVHFGIRGQDIAKSLPSRIPLATVLHFAPKLEQWIIPDPPYDAPLAVVDRTSLHKPYIGVNITERITPRGLELIINRMLQTVRPTHDFNFSCDPDITLSCEVLKAWKALDLPEGGIQSLFTHLLCRLMVGPYVTLIECKALWMSFPITSPVIRELIHNYVRGLKGRAYGPKEIGSIEEWICKNKDRSALFNAIEGTSRGPDGNGQIGTMTFAEPGLATATAMKDKANSEVLERGRTLKVPMSQRRERERQDSVAMRQRLRRQESDDSIRSVDSDILGYPPTPAAREPQAFAVPEKSNGPRMNDPDNSKGTALFPWKNSISARLAQTNLPEPKSLSKPVSSFDLFKALEKLEIDSNAD